jgi:hypothetical protein
MAARKNQRRSSTPTSKTSSRKASGNRWSGRVTRESHALDLDQGVFTWSNPKRIARSLKQSAELSRRRKTDPFRSAMAMLVFFINRAGKNLSARQRRTLEAATDELRKQFHRRPRVQD